MSSKVSHRGYWLILASAIGFGSYGVWSKLIGADFGVFSQGWVRSLLVLLILVPLAYGTKQMKPVTRQGKKWLLITVLFGIGTQAPLYYAYNHMDIGTATLVFYAMFLVASYLVGRLFIGERMTLTKGFSLLLALLGLICIFGFSLAIFSLAALLLAALNGVASGGEVASTKLSSKSYSSLQIGVYVWAGIFVTHLPAALMTGEKFVMPQLNIVWLAMIAYTIIGALSTYLVFEGFKYVDAGVGGLISLVEIIVAIILGVIFFGETLTAPILLGSTLILLAGMLPNFVLIGKNKLLPKNKK